MSEQEQKVIKYTGITPEEQTQIFIVLEAKNQALHIDNSRARKAFRTKQIRQVLNPYRVMA